MLETLGILAVGRNVSPKTFVRIQLFLQVYLLATSILLLSVATQILTEKAFSCPTSSTAELQDYSKLSQDSYELSDDIAKKKIGSSSLDPLSVAGVGMLVYGLVLLPSSLLCVIVHSYYGYIATAACVRTHILVTLLLCAMCIYSLARVILLVTVACGQEGPLGLMKWLPAMVPLYLAALLAHIWITYMLLTINLDLKKSLSSPLPPKIILPSPSSQRTSNHQTDISFIGRLSQAVHVLKNPIDLINGTNRHRLSSLERLHVENTNSVILFEIPLTPHLQNGVAPIDEKFDFDLPDAVATTRPQYHQSTINQYLSDYQSISNRFTKPVEEL